MKKEMGIRWKKVEKSYSTLFHTTSPATDDFIHMLKLCSRSLTRYDINLNGSFAVFCNSDGLCNSLSYSNQWFCFTLKIPIKCKPVNNNS